MVKTLWPWVKLQPTPNHCCHADVTMVSTVRAIPRGRPPRTKRSQMVFHLRGKERFWHWRDQTHNLREGT